VALFINEILIVLFADAEHLGLALRTCPLRGRAAILHLDRLGIADLHFFPALHTISLHAHLLLLDAMRLALVYEHVNK